MQSAPFLASFWRLFAQPGKRFSDTNRTIHLNVSKNVLESKFPGTFPAHDSSAFRWTEIQDLYRSFYPAETERGLILT